MQNPIKKGLKPNLLKSLMEILDPSPNNANSIKYFETIETKPTNFSQSDNMLASIVASTALLIIAKRMKKIIKGGSKLKNFSLSFCF